MSLLQQMASVANPAPLTYIEDVFSTYLYTGNGSTQTITNGVPADLVWIKGRSGATDHKLTDSVRGVTKALITDTTGAQTTDANGVTALGASSFAIGTDSSYNTNAATYAPWSFAKKAKFFDVQQVTVSGSNQTVDLSGLGTVGMVVVKRTDSTSAWYTFHRSCTSGKLVYLNTTATETTDGSITLSGTTLTLVQATIGNGTYIVYAWAHDTASTGLIQCGSWNATSSTRLVTSLGWEPQFLLYKRIDDLEDWQIVDNMREFLANDGTGAAESKNVHPNTSGAEVTNYQIDIQSATGFGSNLNYGAGGKMIYLAIRRGPMKLPTVGTQVFNTFRNAGTNAAANITGVGFPPDAVIVKNIDSNTLSNVFADRLRGPTALLKTDTTEAEVTSSAGITAFTMDGLTLGADATNKFVNYYNTDWYHKFFLRRYPGVFDVVCYTGTGSATTIVHNLGVIPEFIIVKSRTESYNWYTLFYYSSTQDIDGPLNSSAAMNGPRDYSAGWAGTVPTASVFSIGAGYTGLNATSEKYVAYLFATLAGISKVSSYTGNGSSQTINCGFAAGARFILIKRTDSTGDWFVWDVGSNTGIVAGNDSHSSLNTSTIVQNGDDSVDPDNSGFIVNENATTHINVNTATYIYLAFA